MTPRGGNAWAWMAALSATIALHAAALWGLRPGTSPSPPPERPQVWRITVRPAVSRPPVSIPPPRSTEPEPPVATPAPPPPPPSVTEATEPETPPASAIEPAPAPVPEADADPMPAPNEAPDRSTDPAPESERPTLSHSGWLDATEVDESPAPIDNEWVLASRPWPRAYRSIIVRLWISAEGRIERYEVEGDAADDPAVQALFAPITQTPMRPARIGRRTVPSTMRIELWSGDSAPLDFVAPLGRVAGTTD